MKQPDDDYGLDDFKDTSSEDDPIDDGYSTPNDPDVDASDAEYEED